MNPSSQPDTSTPVLSIREAVARFDGGAPPTLIRVRGELTDVSRPRSGHVYAWISDPSGRLPCVLFRRWRRRIDAALRDGVLVTVEGVLQRCPRGGHLEIDVRSAVVENDRGPLRIESDAVRARLLAEGLLHPARKRPLPPRLGCVGLVTSPDGAVIEDLRAILRRGAPGLRTELAPVRVTGAGAADGIAQAIRAFSRAGTADVVVVARGGGSSADLAAFDSEAVARAVGDCRVPVIAAIGHAPDVTVTDLVADVRCATPSEAAELIVRTWAGPSAQRPADLVDPTEVLQLRIGGMAVTVRIASPPAGEGAAGG